jgi:glycosyltransferase involved in cell wall biosynthesis
LAYIPNSKNTAQEDLVKLTIITVTLNSVDQLRGTIENVARLKGRYHEYIVVDGGSSDGTQDLLAEYSDVVTFWVSEKDRGIYDAMNKGWRLANVDSRILFLGAGDGVISLPDLQQVGEHDVVYGEVKLEGRGLFRSRADWRLMFGNTLHHQSLLVPKSAHTASPFNCDFPTYADFDFNLRLRRAGIKFIHSPKFMSYAAAGGVSHVLNVDEMVAVCRHNYGVLVVLLAWPYLWLQKLKIKFWFM